MWRVGRCGADLFYTITVQPDGRFLVQMEGLNDSCARTINSFTGTVQNNTLRFTFARGANTFTISK